MTCFSIIAFVFYLPWNLRYALRNGAARCPRRRKTISFDASNCLCFQPTAKVLPSFWTLHFLPPHESGSIHCDRAVGYLPPSLSSISTKRSARHTFYLKLSYCIENKRPLNLNFFNSQHLGMNDPSWTHDESMEYHYQYYVAVILTIVQWYSLLLGAEYQMYT